MRKKRRPGYKGILDILQKKMKIVVSAATILMVLITAVTLMAMVEPQSSLAFVVEGEDCGLEVTPAEEFTDVSNLNPGDTKSSYLIVENAEGEDITEYYFCIEKIAAEIGRERVDALKERDGYGTEPLSEALEFTVKREGDEEPLFEGTVSEFQEAEDYDEDKEGLRMGSLDVGDSQTLNITVHLSGPDVGNEFQGSNVTAEFKFRAECDDPPGTRTERATLEVKKFHDLDETGEWDEGDPEIEGWGVIVNDREYETPVTLRRLRPGTYTIKEVERDGWEATTDTEKKVRLRGGDRKTVEFGNYREVPEEATLTVRKFHDLEQTGRWDDGDPEIMDWTVFINGEEYETPLSLELEPGDYTVSEEVVGGWEPTTDTEVDITLEEGESKTVEFGNYEEEIVIPPEPPEVEPEPDRAALSVYKFHDEDMDGVWDEDEEEIEDWVIYVDGEEIERERLNTPVVLDDLEPGRYIVMEQDLDGWEATRDTRVEIELEEGDVETVVFGNVPEEEIEIITPEPEAPPTWEMPPYVYYGVGVMLMLAGALLGRIKFLRKKNK